MGFERAPEAVRYFRLERAVDLAIYFQMKVTTCLELPPPFSLQRAQPPQHSEFDTRTQLSIFAGPYGQHLYKTIERLVNRLPFFLVLLALAGEFHLVIALSARESSLDDRQL